MQYPEDFIDKVICGDCQKIMADIPNEEVHFIFTDPPYCIVYPTK